MIVNLTLSVTLTLPDGSTSLDDGCGRAWSLPNGDWIKPWITLELNDQRDLTQEEIAALEIDIEEMVEAVEIIEEREA
jgi:hypothetical protein